jgi:hypothetical protein
MNAAPTCRARAIARCPGAKAVDAATKKSEGHDEFSFGPDVDGYFAGERARIFTAGKQNDVPLAGWNHDEGSFEVAKTKPTKASLKESAEKKFGEKAPEFLRLYSADNDDQAYRPWKTLKATASLPTQPEMAGNAKSQRQADRVSLSIDLRCLRTRKSWAGSREPFRRDRVRLWHARFEAASVAS